MVWKQGRTGLAHALRDQLQAPAVAEQLAATGYLCDESLATVVFLSGRMQRPLLLEGEPGTGNTEAKIGGDPQHVSNLTVWENVETLENFVWNTVHRQFYERRTEWFEVLGEMHFVMWWVPEGHLPSLEEGLEKLAHLRENGASDFAFDWAWLEQAKLYKAGRCGAIAAE
ncbi:DUF3291 domain-containing protein [uncultured Sulfitobacter sp.]|uniref:DUF3291 domain-containing protein n=1 Tax=uncultured Sulfitobacter sp. TaxID=191468 RepID=UPI002593B9F9|nr:DUF3291 domain-containing protein [uncultured Sulfitobacter sp.]